jgi:hypothetical protein
MNLQKNKVLVPLCILFSFLVSSAAMANKSVYGYLEPVKLHPNKISLTAKLDTGARTASLSATDIHLYEKNGKEYVKFKVSHPKIEQTSDYNLPLIRQTRIKNRVDEGSRTKNNHSRPVVNIQIYFDGKPYEISVNLIDRSHFSTPMLLGRRALEKLGVIVDGTTKNTILKNKSKSSSRSLQDS